MEFDEIRSKCERLRNQGQDSECRDLLLRHGYFQGLEPRVQALFLSYFPPSETLKKEMSGSLHQLSSENPVLRLKAAKYLSGRARGNWSLDNKLWLADPRTVDVLLMALSDNDDGVLRFVINALGNLSQRYSFPDLRIKEALLPIFDSAGDPIRLEIVQAIPQFARDERVCEVILAGLKCRPEKRACWTVGLAVSRYAGSLMTMKSKMRFMDALMPVISKQKNVASFEVMLSAIIMLNLPETLELLNSLCHSVPPALAESLNDAIEELKESRGSKPETGNPS
jgi:hypothetical protein